MRDCAPGLTFELGSAAKGNCINAEFQNPKHECDFVLSWTLRKERYGLFALEMAGDEQKAREVLASRDEEEARSGALLNVYLDYLFLVIYSTTIGPACLWGAGTLRA